MKKILVKVRPHSGKSEVEEKEGFYLVYLKSAPENNRANIELAKLLRSYFKASGIKIKSGFTSRKKVIEILE